MISIFVMYSPDRLSTFQDMLTCMKDMDGYEKSDRILLVDGEPNVYPDGWRVLVVPRSHGEFVWARMWDAGVEAARSDVILYLDSDRVLPVDYLRRVLNRVEDDVIVSCGSMFGFRRRVPVDIIKDYRDMMTPERLRHDYQFHRDVLHYDPRFMLPCDGPGKGVMSGNVAFTKNTYLRSGGVDPFYVGHGAWADNDFHKQCHEMGFAMIDMNCLELHLWHRKIHEEKLLEESDIEILCLKNYIYYCLKWNVGFDRARAIVERRDLGKDFIKNEIRKLSSVYAEGRTFPCRR